MMILIKDKIKENVKQQKELIKTADEIRLLREEQDKIISSYDEIVEKMVAKLTTERILTTLKRKDVHNCKDEAYFAEDIIGFNQTGMGSLSKYSKNLNQLRNNEIREILLNSVNKLIPYFKNKPKALEILKLFKTLTKLKEIKEIKWNLIIETNDFNNFNQTCSQKINFDTDNPFRLCNRNTDIRNIEQYIPIEQHHDFIKKNYEELIKIMTINNANLELELTKLKNTFAGHMVAEAL